MIVHVIQKSPLFHGTLPPYFFKVDPNNSVTLSADVLRDLFVSSYANLTFLSLTLIMFNVTEKLGFYVGAYLKPLRTKNKWILFKQLARTAQ
jgi:hypothetical protein